MDALRTIGSVKAVGRAEPRAGDRNAVNFREEEEAAEMEDLRERRRAVFREVADRARRALRVIDAARGLAWAAAAISAVASAMAEELADREVDSETIDRARASFQRLRQKILNSVVMMKSVVRAIRRGISALARIISTKKMRRQGTAPADLSSLRRRRKLSRK